MQHVWMAQVLEKVLSDLFQIKYIGSNLGTQTLTDYMHQPVAWNYSVFVHTVNNFLKLY